MYQNASEYRAHVETQAKNGWKKILTIGTPAGIEPTLCMR